MAFESAITEQAEAPGTGPDPRHRHARIPPAERAAAPEPLRAHFGTTPPTAVRSLVGRFMTDTLHAAYVLGGNDLGAILVLLEIAERSFEHRYPPHVPVAELASRDQDEARAAHAPLELCACNVLSLSEVDGMPRETVRRKVAKLLDLGWIEPAAEGGYVITGIGTRIVDFLVLGQLPETLKLSERVREFEQCCESADSGEACDSLDLP